MQHVHAQGKPGLLFDAPDPPTNDRLLLSIAVAVTILLHLLATVLASIYPISLIGPAETLAQRAIPVKVLTREPRNSDPGPESGGRTPKPLPGTPPESVPPPVLPTSPERAFALPDPVIGQPPPVKSPADPARMVPAVAIPAMPSEIPLSQAGRIKVAPNAPSAPDANPDPRASPGITQPKFQLPDVQPGTLAAERLVALEGGGTGPGGAGDGSAPEIKPADPRIQDPIQMVQGPKGSVVLRLYNEVLFDFDSARVRPEAEPTLGRVAEIIKKHPGADVTVQGHTDSFGTADYNQGLSERRAASVAQWLRTKYLQIATLQSVGFGATKPLVNQAGTVEQQQPNRRVEIHIRAKSKDP